MNHYETLGVDQNASQEDIKRAYKKLAMKFHPDRGGDERRFKEISAAYDVLSNPQKKQEYDFSRNGNGGFSFQFGGGSPFDDMFGGMFRGASGGFQFRSRPQNSTVGIEVAITLEEAFAGKELDAAIDFGSKQKTINVKIPAGVDNGSQVRFAGMGDDSIQGVPPGDLIINIRVMPHQRFVRDRNNLILDYPLSIWDAILGTDIEVETLDRRKLTITIPSGSQPESMFSCRGEGMPDVQGRGKGNLFVRLKITVPKVATEEQKRKIMEMKNGF